MWIEDFVNCLEESTLEHSRIDEALAIKQKYLPKRIYKYRRDGDYSRYNLKTDTVWLCSPEAYNDPYDCTFTLSNDLVVAALKQSLVDDFVRIYELQDVVSAEQIENAKKSKEPLKTITEDIQAGAPGSKPERMAEFCSTVAPQLVKGAISVLRQWRKLTKLCSFSAVNDSLLMWSHYADDHKGFCLEYNLECLKEDHELRRLLYPVVYSTQLYDLTRYAVKLVGPDRSKFNPISPLLGVLHKFDGWKYEEEWRLVSITQAPTDAHNRPVPTPSRIFFGSRMEAAKEEELLAICEQKGVEMRQMRLANDRFELLAEPFG